MTTPTKLAGLAPHADPQWVEDFVLEQRLLGISGARIGDALATLNEHLADTGDSVESAFGPAKDYARELAAAGPKAPDSLRSTLISAVCGLIGIILAPRALVAALEHTGVEVTTGDLAGLLLVGALVAALGAFATPILRSIVEHRRVAALGWGLGMAGLIAILVTVFLLWRTPLVTVPAWLVGLAALAALAVSVRMSLREAPDLVATPDGRTLGRERTATLMNAALTPALAAVMCLVSWTLWSMR